MSSASRLHLEELGVEWHWGRMSLRLRARLAAALYFLAVAIAVSGEFFVPGKLGIAAILLPVVCSVMVTLLLYSVFRSVNRGVALSAALFNLVGLALEGVQWQPRGVNLAMVLHSIYAILLGCLMARSRLLPWLLGAMMALAGFVWLIYLVPSAARQLAPLNTAGGLLSEAVPMLWFLAMGVRATNGSASSDAGEVRS